MHFSGRRVSASLLSALALGVALTGCGSSSDSAKDEPTQAASTPAAETTTTAASAPAASSNQHDALESMAKQAEGQIGSLKKAFEGMYSDIAIETEDPGTLIYRYTYAKGIDGSAAEGALKKQYPTLQSSCETAVFPAMKAAGVTADPKVLYEFLNVDGSTIGSYTCTDK